MKLSDENEAGRQHHQDYINKEWRSWYETVNNSLSRVVDHLFVLNAGAMVGCITYLATKTEPNKGITEALRLFFVGLICIFFRAVVDYYSSLNLFGDFRKNVDSYYRNALDWERLIETKAKTKVTAFVAHTLGWLSALCCLAGIVLGMSSLP